MMAPLELPTRRQKGLEVAPPGGRIWPDAVAQLPRCIQDVVDPASLP